MDTLGRSSVTALGKVEAGLANDFEPVVGSLGLADDFGFGGFLAGHGWVLIDQETGDSASDGIIAPFTSVAAAQVQLVQ